MSLIQLIYCSKSSNNLAQNDIESIWLNSIMQNTKHSISGILMYYDHCFIQLLEGDETQVKKLYSNIMIDDRHYDVTLIGQQYIENKEFKRWAIGCITDNAVSIKVIRKYFPSDFNPKNSSFSILKNLLLEISRIKEGVVSIILP